MVILTSIKFQKYSILVEAKAGQKNKKKVSGKEMTSWEKIC